MPTRLLNQRLAPFGTSIFAEMTQLAVRHNAVNLGQGYPDFDGPEFVKDAAIDAIRAGHNQYCRPWGAPPLTEAIAEHRERFYGLSYDAESEVTVFAGATEAIFATLQALFEPGDEAVVFEPTYDSYRPALALAQAMVRSVPLVPPHFDFDPSSLAQAVTSRTRAIILNSPHNPTGKVFQRAELEQIAEICRARDLLVITDEVYEHLTFDVPHIPMASLPGMRKRTVMLSSTGTTFALTGWKVGFACAPTAISHALRMAHQFITYCTSTPFQHAMAVALRADDGYFTSFAADYRRRRDRLCAGLTLAGFAVPPPDGTYFATADVRSSGAIDGEAFCRALPERAGVAAIPVSAFCADPAPFQHLVRFAFCKSDQTLDEGICRLVAAFAPRSG
jgi:N-succinyldiaminopimelate aminotransferase